MADDADRASAYETQAIAGAIANTRRASKPTSLAYCLECGDKIPEQRQQAEPGCELCVPCKSWQEKHGFWPSRSVVKCGQRPTKKHLDQLAVNP